MRYDNNNKEAFKFSDHWINETAQLTLRIKQIENISDVDFFTLK